MIRTFLVSTAALMTASAAEAQYQTGADLGEGIDENVAARMLACGIDAPELERLINLPQREFDQDFDGGWRPYGGADDCQHATGELILTYLTYSPHVETDGVGILRWHAGQMFASAGAYDRAIALFVAAKNDEPSAWNAYADATIAFLRGDREAIEAARDALLEFAPSPEEQAANQRFLDENPNIRMPDGFVTDPPNLPVVDRLIACWGEDYWTAYTGCDAGLKPSSAQTSTSLEGCEFLERRLNMFMSGVNEDVRPAISANWLTSPGDRDTLVALLNQDGRESGPDAPFAMEYRQDFADAIASLTEADIDELHANLTTPSRIDCPRAPLDFEPFTDDMAGFLRWAEDQMMNPDPGAPDGAQTLAMSRPVLFDGGRRAIVVESFTYTPIPLSRPPSAGLSFVVYAYDEGRWATDAAMVIARGG